LFVSMHDVSKINIANDVELCCPLQRLASQQLVSRRSTCSLC
jgi:hypothetical protein